jgi:hypothetical protein
MAISKLIFLLLLFSVLSGQSQTLLKKIKEIKSAEVVLATVDRLGNFFISTKNSTTKKFDSNGKTLAMLKGRNITLLEPWFHPFIFTYSLKQKSYAIYGRFFENEDEKPLDPAWAIDPLLVCPGNDNKLWLFDKADASLKKVNPLTAEVMTEFNVDTAQFKVAPHFTHLREYQNMIFLLDQNSGILIFSNIGKQINKIKKAGILNFNFFGEELYYIDGTEIKLFDLYSEEIHHLEVKGENKFALLTDERLILVNQKNRIFLFEVKW